MSLAMGNYDYIWFLYEKIIFGKFLFINRGFLILDLAFYGRLMIIPAVFAFSGRFLEQLGQDLDLCFCNASKSI